MPRGDPSLTGLGLIADVSVLSMQLLIIESAARQAGVDLVTARVALYPIWERHRNDEPSLEGVIDMIDEVVVAL